MYCTPLIHPTPRITMTPLLLLLLSLLFSTTMQVCGHPEHDVRQLHPLRHDRGDGDGGQVDDLRPHIWPRRGLLLLLCPQGGHLRVQPVHGISAPLRACVCARTSSSDNIGSSASSVSSGGGSGIAWHEWVWFTNTAQARAATPFLREEHIRRARH